MIYRDFIIDLYKNPLNKRQIHSPTCTASGANTACGDHVRIYLKIKGSKIIDASFEGEGCAISIATAELLTEKAKSLKIAELKRWGSKEIFDLIQIELGPSRAKCAMLPLETLQNALKKF